MTRVLVGEADLLPLVLLVVIETFIMLAQTLTGTTTFLHSALVDMNIWHSSIKEMFHKKMENEIEGFHCRERTCREALFELKTAGKVKQRICECGNATYYSAKK